MPFSRGPLLAPAPPPAPRWPRFGYLAEGDYAQCLGPLCQRDTIVMLVATLLRAAICHAIIVKQVTCCLS